MSILVTGASGLLGLTFCLEASKRHETVYGVAHTQPLDSAPFTVLRRDLLSNNSARDLIEEAQPDCVVHCAALTSVDGCEENPGLAFALNRDVPAQLAGLSAEAGARFVHVSTDAVFDGERGDYTEADAPNPLNVYGRSKLAGERAVVERNADALIVRVNFFGWSMPGDRSLSEFFLGRLRTRRTAPGFTDAYFCPLLANQLSNILLDLVIAGLCGLFHVVSREALSKYEFGRAVARQFGLDEELVLPSSLLGSGLAAPRASLLTLNSQKASRALGRDLPSVFDGLTVLHALHRSGYPQRLRGMAG